MKKIIVLLLVMGMFAGCNGVNMNAEYSGRLDETVALSGAAARQAQINTAAALAGELTEDEILEALVWSNKIIRRQDQTWIKFQQARDGVAE